MDPLKKADKAQSNVNMIDVQRIGLWIGALVLALDSICLIMIGEFEFVIAVGMGLGIVVISTNLWPYIGMQKPYKDERAARVGAMAGLSAWYISLVTAALAAVILGYLPASWNIHLNAAQALGGVILVMVVSMVCIYEYMSWKGVTE
ncbi:hypothetical protein [Methanocella sp. MCL-LM]|uniref:hypothetical protein n=1 Tax=Methanocella sp. MCL-LM TaxID=3412035 RepID=UPI003C7694F6